MTDNVDRRTRSRMMAAIRGKDTEPEKIIRRALHADGLRFRLHAKKLPGKPDLVLPKWRAVIQIHGCFWHRHDCHYFVMPRTRRGFWLAKLSGNRRRDKQTERELRTLGWRVATVWECSMRDASTSEIATMTSRLAAWVRNTKRRSIDLRGPT